MFTKIIIFVYVIRSIEYYYDVTINSYKLRLDFVVKYNFLQFCTLISTFLQIVLGFIFYRKHRVFIIIY